MLGLAIAICSALLSATCAIACWRLASESYLLLKRRRELEALTAELNSNFENLLESHKRLRSREGMRTLREKRTSTAVETKAQLLQRLGLAGKAGPDFARAQLQLNANDPN